MTNPLGFDSTKASCRGTDIHLFYPDAQTSKRVGAVALQRQAIAICETCEVKNPCLEYALRFEASGVWGGTTEVEREFLRIKRNISLPIEMPKPDTVKRALRKRSIQQMLEKGLSDIG